MPTTLLVAPTDGVPPDLIPPLLNLRSDSLLLPNTIGPHARLVFRRRRPDRLVRLGVFLELVDKVVKVLLLLLPVFQRPFLQLGVVALYPVVNGTIRYPILIFVTCLEQLFFGGRNPIDQGWASDTHYDAAGLG